jgi:ribosomal protein L44E
MVRAAMLLPRLGGSPQQQHAGAGRAGRQLSLIRPLAAQVNIPKSKRAFCKGCKKHMTMKVTQYKTGKASLYAQGEQRPRRSAGSLRAGAPPQEGPRASHQLRAAPRCPARPTSAVVWLPRRQEALRPQTVRLRWPDQARLPQEGAPRARAISSSTVTADPDRCTLESWRRRSQAPHMAAPDSRTPQAKTTKKVVLRMQCQECKQTCMKKIKVGGRVAQAAVAAGSQRVQGPAKRCQRRQQRPVPLPPPPSFPGRSGHSQHHRDASTQLHGAARPNCSCTRIEPPMLAAEQAPRPAPAPSPPFALPPALQRCKHFEIGGDKKTKGAY